MRHVAPSQQLKLLVVTALALVFAVWLGWSIGHDNYVPILLGAAICLLCIALFSGPFFWVLVVASSFLGGTFPILRGQFTPFQLLMLIGISKFLIEDIVFRHRRINFGNRFDLILIAIFMGILTMHGIHDRFGMRFLGSSIWGGHNYVDVYVGFIAYFVVQTVKIKPQVWRRLPFAVLFVTSFDLLIAIITTISPSLIYVIYPFYSAVSAGGLEEIMTGDPSLTQRIGAIGNFGFILIAIVLASISLRRLLNPAHLFRLLTAIGGCLTVLYSGYRSTVLNTLILWVIAGIRDLKMWALGLLPLFAALLFSLSFINSEFFHLPKQVQRGLAFLPGKWDTEMALDAAASNDYRQQIWTLWAKNYFPAHPWFGRGFGFKSEWAESTFFQGSTVDYEQVVETGLLHNGLFAAVDTFGIVGTVAFALWNLRILVRTFRVPLRTDVPWAIAVRFLALFLGTRIISYWGGALSVGSFLPAQFAISAVLFTLQQALPSRESERADKKEMILAENHPQFSAARS